MGATGAAAGAEVWGGGHGALGACVAARYVRLVCVAKRRGLEAEPFVVRRLGVLPLLAMAAQDEILGDSEGDAEGGGTSGDGDGAGGARPATSAARGNSSGGGAAPKVARRSAAAEAARTAREARRAREASLLRDGFDFEAIGVGRPTSLSSSGLALAACHHPTRYCWLHIILPSRWAASRPSWAASSVACSRLASCRLRCVRPCS